MRWKDMRTCSGDGNLKQRQEWTLDALGNWGTNAVRVSGTTLTETRTHNKANEYLASSGSGLPSITFAHDDNGNITDDGTYLYEYDMENRLTRVKLKSNSDVIAVYRYDALGRRVRKIVTNSGGLNGTYHEVQSPDWQLLEVRHDAGTNEVLDQEFVYASAAPPTRGRGVGSGYIDDRVAYWSSGTLRYYHCDAQYCTLALTATTGTPITIAERYVTSRVVPRPDQHRQLSRLLRHPRKGLHGVPVLVPAGLPASAVLRRVRRGPTALARLLTMGAYAA